MSELEPAAFPLSLPAICHSTLVGAAESQAHRIVPPSTEIMLSRLSDSYNSDLVIPDINPVSPHDFKATLDTFWPYPVSELWSKHVDYLKLYCEVCKSALPNYLATRASVPSALKITAWRDLLKGYHDTQLVDYLDFGWPLDYVAPHPPALNFKNHETRDGFIPHIKTFLDTELAHGAIIGPFSSPPFSPWSQVSPMMTRDKKGSSDRRVVVDLSFPKGRSVNSGIKKGCYQGEPFVFTLPSMTDLSSNAVELGPGCFLWSADLARAYRQLRICPLSAPLLGLIFNNQYYLDTAPSFGCRISALACARTTSAVVWLMQQKGYTVYCYLDDFVGIARTRQEALAAYSYFMYITKRLGLELSLKKCTPPVNNLIWLGLELNTELMTVTIPEEKLKATLTLCQKWLEKKKASRSQLRSLLGKLKHINTCIPPASSFFARILATLRATPFTGYHTLPNDFYKDVLWFVKFAQRFNGIVLLPPPAKEDWVIECDSSMEGAGAFSSKTYYMERYSDKYKSQLGSINNLEALNLIHALAHLLPESPSRFRILINTDSKVTQQALTNGTARQPLLSACARQLWLYAASESTEVVVVHKPGSELVLADSLSRASQDAGAHSTALKLCAQRRLKRIRVNHDINILTFDM